MIHCVGCRRPAESLERYTVNLDSSLYIVLFRMTGIKGQLSAFGSVGRMSNQSQSSVILTAQHSAENGGMLESTPLKV